ncbi:MAG: NAD(P)H-flavin reductase [Legionellaceae bacterium]
MSPKVTNASIVARQQLNETTLCLTLRPEVFIPYEAGQYLDIILDKQRLSYSIANAPLGSQTYDLHLRNTPPFNTMKSLLIELPFGTCTLQTIDPNQKLIFIAGGTGFSPVHAMIQQLHARQDQRSIALYWRVRSMSELYFNDVIQTWQHDMKHFSFFPLCSTEQNTPLSQHIVDQQGQNIKKSHIILAGPFDMIYNLRDELIAYGLSKDQLSSDAFSFEK